MPPLPLFRLPGLVLFEVFKSLSIGEKINLSLCSKKISTQINNARLCSQKVIVNLDMLDHGMRVRTENNRDTFDIFISLYSRRRNDPDMQQCQIDGHTVPLFSFTREIDTFWKNYQEGFLSIIRHLSKMFQCKILISGSCHCSDIFQPIISELFNLQLEFETLIIRPNGSKDENLLWNQISNKFGLVEDLNILSIVDPGFKPVFSSWPQKISITSSAWFTLESLLVCPCSFINLEDSHLKTNDLDVILKKWKAGGFPNLERRAINGQDITNNETTILGMSLWELSGMVIQTDDGAKKATINTDYGRIKMSVTPFE